MVTLEERAINTKGRLRSRTGIITDSLGKYDIKYISNRFRPLPNDDLSQDTSIIQTNDMIDELTIKQYQVLDNLSGNDQFMIKGSAGTGKTFLAKEIFCRKVKEGNRSLFLCHSEPLGIVLRHSLMDIVDIETNPIISISEIDKKVQDSDKDSSLDSYLSYICSDGSELFDVLVIDEFQDVMAIDGIELIIDGILKNGFAKGSWYFFGDLTRQATKMNVEDIRNKFDDNQIFSYSLDINCRNTIN